MLEKDYDSLGTAKMLVDSVTRTLGLTKRGLAVRLRHLAYDGYN